MCSTYQKLDGKVALITGGSSGIGFETAKNLAKRGAKVIIASRNKTKLMDARHKIIKDTGNYNVKYGLLDLSSLKSVRNFANETIHAEKRLDIFISNAGAVTLPDTLSEDGLNLTMQVNYFGAFLLTYLLLPLIKASSPSRIIKEQASSMYFGHIDFDHWNDLGQSRIVEIANSKLAGALFIAELDKRLQGYDVAVNSYDPFIVADTDILNDAPEIIKLITHKISRILGQPKDKVGNQIAYLAAEPSLEHVTGKHYLFCEEFFKHWLANDEELTKRVWETSKKLVGITLEEDWELNSI